MIGLFRLRARGFSLIEVMVSLLITLVVMASVFLLLQRGQRSFHREPEVSDVNANARTGMHRIGQDLALAGYKTPITIPLMWFDGGGITPDEITIIYADPDIPVSSPKPCGGGGGAPGGGGPGGGGGPCNTIGSSSTLNLDPYTFSPQPADFETAYTAGMTLFALQGPNGNPACDGSAPGIIPFEVTQPPNCTGAGGANTGPAGCATLNLNHNPGSGGTINVPGGFNNDVSVDCAVVGFFHVVQYRVNPLPPADNPSLERRDIALGDPWSPLALNIENLQFQYGQGGGNVFNEVPLLTPIGNDPNSWITGVRLTVAGRSESTNLEGASAGVFAAEDTFLRRSFTTTMSLRNQLNQAAQRAMDLGLPGWN
jgi:prepilin-type N-terminal cleavage/methylation domain-containing protein